MKLRHAASSALLLLLSSFACAQDSSLQPPPIRMGLWQSESTSSLSGADNSPIGQAMAAHNDRVTVSQACMTPDTWKDALHKMQSRRQDMNCTVSNLQQDAHRVAFDESCDGQQGYGSKVHVEMLLDSEESMHGTASVKMTGAAFPEGLTMNMKMNSKYLSSDCGNVKPGEGKVIHP